MMLFGRKQRRISRLLIVEDEPLVAFDAEHYLTEHGFEVVATVDTVAAATALLESDAPIDLVLADLQLADGSGIDVARTAQRRGVPVMFVTGRTPDEVAASALALGCLAKPYPQRDLIAAIAAIETVVEGKTPRRPPPGLRLFRSTAQ